MTEFLDKVKQDISDLEAAKLKALSLEGKKSAYIKERVFKHNERFWAEWEMLMNSDDKNDRKFAISEYNKLQQKVLPTELTGADGEKLIPQPLLGGQSIINN